MTPDPRPFPDDEDPIARAGAGIALTRLEHISAVQDQHTVALSRIQATQKQHGEAIGRLETDMTAMKTDVAELKTDVAELKTNMARVLEILESGNRPQ